MSSSGGDSFVSLVWLLEDRMLGPTLDADVSEPGRACVQCGVLCARLHQSTSCMLGPLIPGHHLKFGIRLLVTH